MSSGTDSDYREMIW